jgi:hypothetical protein
MPNTEAQKRARKKWVENNKELNLQLINQYTKAYYQKHKEERLLYAKQYREKKKAENENIEINN